MITIYKNISSVTSGFHRNVDYIFDRIKIGKSKILVEAIRNEPDKSNRNILKKQLPSICFSGTFNQRIDTGIIEHSGLICLDFDNFKTTKDLALWREKISKDKFTYSVFTSPSGDGLKLIIKIPANVLEHGMYFDAIKEYWNCEYFDDSSRNISRVCYESYDPDIFINNSSETWTDKEEEQHLTVGVSDPVVVLKSENRIIQNLLKWYEKKHGNSKGSRNTNMFKLASAFNDFGINKNEAENVFQSFVEKDFTEKEIETIIKSAYKKPGNTKFFEDKQTKEKIEKLVKQGNSLKKIQETFTDYTFEEIEHASTSIKETLSVTEFWATGNNGNVSIRPHKFKEYLEQQGFCKIFPQGSENFIFVKIKENIIDNITPSHIKDYVLNYLYLNPSFGISAYDFIANSPKFFKDDYLSLINTLDIDFKNDTEKTCYLYYENCAIEVTGDEIKEIDYIELQGFVWKDQIIKRKYIKSNFDDSEYRKFIMLISGNDIAKFNSLCSVIGYFMHSYKSMADNKAIIFNDEIISENPNGGSGKGIFCSAIGRMKNVATIDGKQFDFNKSFPYQTVGVDTQVLVFDDVKKNFAFENLFSLVTEGITLEKKNKDAIKLPITKSPKIAITTNYTIGGAGGSFERRKFEIELSSYFGVNHTPHDEFKHSLFDDWNQEEWIKFDNFMVECCQYYLKNGLVKHEFHNLAVRKFIKETSFEFYEMVTDEPLPFDFKIIKANKFNEFILEYPDMKKWLTQKRFSNWLDTYAKFKGLETKTGKDIDGRWVMFLSGEIIDNLNTKNYYEPAPF